MFPIWWWDFGGGGRRGGCRGESARYRRTTIAGTTSTAAHLGLVPLHNLLPLEERGSFELDRVWLRSDLGAASLPLSLLEHRARCFPWLFELGRRRVNPGSTTTARAELFSDLSAVRDGMREREGPRHVDGGRTLSCT